MKRTRFLKLMGLELFLLYGSRFLKAAEIKAAEIKAAEIKAAEIKEATANHNEAGTLSERLLFNHQGQQRFYRIYAPTPLPTTPCAAVLLLHGHGGNADQLMGVTGRKAPYRLWMSIAEREHLILIIPDGLVSPDGKQGWNDARNIASNPASDDVDFLNKLVETVAESYSIDFTRVYATGTSNGGQMALRLAAECSDKFSAVAAIVAANPDPIFVQTPQQPISVLLMNGTADRFLPYAGGNVIGDRGRVQSAEDTIRYWAVHNECEESPRFMQYPERVRRDGCTASRTIYRNAATSVEVGLIRILGGGHAEPSIREPYSRLFLSVIGAQNRDIEMADEVWNFFQGKVVSTISQDDQ